MPISRDQFMAGIFGGSWEVAKKILAFLRSNCEQAHTASEIIEACGLSVADDDFGRTLRIALGAMENGGLILKSSIYTATDTRETYYAASP